jgi:hypothetical protein
VPAGSRLAGIFVNAVDCCQVQGSVRAAAKSAMPITTCLSMVESSIATDAAKMKTTLLHRIIHHCVIMKTGKSSFRFKQRKGTSRNHD